MSCQIAPSGRQNGHRALDVEPAHAVVTVQGEWAGVTAMLERPSQAPESVQREVSRRRQQPGQHGALPIKRVAVEPEPRECVLRNVFCSIPIVREGQGESEDRRPAGPLGVIEAHVGRGRVDHLPVHAASIAFARGMPEGVARREQSICA